MVPATSLLLAALAALPAAQAQDCSPLHYIFARATTEPPTNVENASPEEFEEAADKFWSKGYGAAGHSIFTNITALVPDVTGYPVHYPASFGTSSPRAGQKDLLDHITAMSQQCPDQKYVLGGHSQGGVVTVNTIPEIPAEILSRVIAVTMVGSPDCPSEVDDRCRSYCNKGDFICDGGLGGIGGIGGGIGGIGGGLGGLFGRRSLGAGFKSAGMLKTRQAPDCSGPEPEEKGHEAGGGLSAHLAYNEDGFYIYAAACYVQKQYQASGGV
ncbi:condensin complex subunit Cut3 [Onygenales sp. PD_10]|nr:condensin complex subunit Cut3 [Onygenales sp. PD_10]